MPARFLRTSDLAQAASIHPNTVRLYEEWGFLPAIPRTPAGYRMFTPAHLDQLLMARAILRCAWLGGAIRDAALGGAYAGAAGDLAAALEHARAALAGVQAEQAQAEAAAAFLQQWAHGERSGAPGEPLPIGEAARVVGSTADALRNWERNGLIRVPRDPDNGYRRYGPAEIGRLRVIRTLLRAGYSTMAVLRTMLHVDTGRTGDLRQVLDTPAPDEPGMGYGDDLYFVTDHWLTTLAEIEQHVREAVARLEDMIARQGAESRQ